MIVLLFAFLYIFTLYAGENLITPRPLSSISHSGIIQCSIHPWRKQLETELAEISQLRSSSSESEYSSSHENLKDPFDAYFSSQKPPTENIEYELARRILKRAMLGVDGVFAFYRGYVTISDSQGLITFPRLEQQRTLTIIITTDIAPMQFTGPQPVFWIIPPLAHAQWYTCTGSENQAEGSITWLCTRVTPSQNKIPDGALIIIAEPAALSFDTKPLIVPFSENFILPDLFATQELTRGIYGVSILEDLRYYRPLQNIDKQSLQQPGMQYARRITDIVESGSESNNQSV